MEKKYRRLKRAIILLAVLLAAFAVLIVCLTAEIRSQESAYETLSEEYESSQKDTWWMLRSWNTSLEQLGIDAEAVFFGDSITRNGNFQEYFEDASVVNLGVIGDTLEDMEERTGMISLVSPEKIFLMGGINSLAEEDPDSALEEYEALLNQIAEENPDAQIYVESVLPVSEDNTVDNSDITAFNAGLEDLAESMELTYIDLYSLYVTEDGVLDPEMTSDGLHLKSDSYSLWYEAVEEFVYDNLP